MPIRMTFRLSLAMAVGALVPTVFAATPTFWQVSTLAEFLKGDTIEHVAVDSDGRLMLGPRNDVVYAGTTPAIWTLVDDGQGAFLAGTGNDGQVLRITLDGQAAVAFDASEAQVHAVAAGPGQAFLAGTAPDGKLYRVAPDGASSVLHDPQDKYIWAVVVAPDGTAYVGTGEKAAVYRVSPAGQAAVLYRPKAANVTALALDPQGNLLVGTESPGQVVRVDSQGRPFVLLDSPFREIHSLRIDARGHVYAVALDGAEGEAKAAPAPASKAPPATPVPVVSTQITVTSVAGVGVDAGVATPSPSADQAGGKPKGAVYRIAPDGLWDTVWQSNDDLPYDAFPQGDGSLLIGTGAKGKIFQVMEGSARATLVARASAQQVTRFARVAGGDVCYAVSNPGKVFRLSSSVAARGEYQSDVRDAGTVATWGAVRWHGRTPPGTTIEISTRSGNTKRPDDNWSDWSVAYADAAGSQIASPKARYLQWRAVLTGKGVTPVLTSVTAAYLPRNARPTVEAITVHPPGTVFYKPYPTGEQDLAGFDSGTSDGYQPGRLGAAASSSTPPALGRRTYEKGLQAFAWKATDEGDDRLLFDVFYRHEGDATWRPLRRGLWDPLFTWDTTSVPDGTYTIKVVASDAPSNAPGAALVGELESVAFEIDNTSPIIERGAATPSGDRTVVRFVVRDGHSAVQRVEYSLDANRWRLVYPVDGIADSREEAFEVVLEGVASAIVRASDSLGNIATEVVGR